MWVADIRWRGELAERVAEMECQVMVRGCFNALQLIADWPGVPGNEGFTTEVNRIGDALLSVPFTDWTRQQAQSWTATPLEVAVYYRVGVAPGGFSAAMARMFGGRVG